jgi:2,4-diketo-3-deoxy-L-fuconate hydrolase
MKLLRFGMRGQEKPGVLDQQGRVRDLSAVVADIGGTALLPNSLAQLRGLDLTTLPRVDGLAQKDLRLGPCVGQVGKCICIGLNYADHAAESGLPVPPEPVVFSKWTSALMGPDDPIEIPRGSVKTDWEVELAVVIAGCASQWALLVCTGSKARAILCSPWAPPSKRCTPCSMHHCKGW